MFPPPLQPTSLNTHASFIPNHNTASPDASKESANVLSNQSVKQTKRDSPLRVRKTRENLRQGSQQAATAVFARDVIGKNVSNESGPALDKVWNEGVLFEGDTLTNSFPPTNRAVSLRHEERCNSNGGYSSKDRISPAAGNVPSQLELQKEAQRRKSVRKRVVSRVKEGILSRSRSTNKILDNLHSSLPLEQEPFNCPERERLQQFNDPTMVLTNGPVFRHISSVANSAEPAMPKTPSVVRLTSLVSESASEASRALQVGPPSDISTQSYSPSPDKTPRPARRPGSRPAYEPNLKPQGALQVDLSFAAAVNDIDALESKAIWVTVKATAIVPAVMGSACDPTCTVGHNSRLVLHPQPRHLPPLDMAIVIDNSFVAQSSTEHVNTVTDYDQPVRISTYTGMYEGCGS